MTLTRIGKGLLWLLLGALFLAGCKPAPHGPFTTIIAHPKISPDYNGITIPSNIAPLNFQINESGKAFAVDVKAGADSFRVTSSSAKIQFPQSRWKELLQAHKGEVMKMQVMVMSESGVWEKYQAIENRIATEPVDSWLFYRLLNPGYESWKKISINERCVESFEEKSLIENSAADENCVNCHSFRQGDNNQFLFHMRGSHGGTFFYKDGELTKMNLKTADMNNGAVYPRWHPSGKYVAFSSNKIIQQFHAVGEKNIEVTDLASELVLYDLASEQMYVVRKDSASHVMDTFPEWSPDGRYLYFCRAAGVGERFDYKAIKYNLCRMPFDEQKKSFGDVEVIFHADSLNKSVSFPRISPDGKYLAFTLHGYGNFSIWHKDADLYLMDLASNQTEKMVLNSDCTESYHTWSQNSKWLVFSSKRLDGLTARPFFAYVGSMDEQGKPFVLPQKDPAFYDKFMLTYNVPELVSGSVDLFPGELSDVIFNDGKPVKSGGVIN